MKIYQYATNSRILGKTGYKKLSHPGAWQPTKGTLQDLAQHIGKGHPWMPALLDGNGERWQSNANYAEVLSLDIDGGMTIAEAMGDDKIARWCGLGIESSSSTPELNKFRLVFPLAEPLNSNKEIRLCNTYLQFLIGTADKACKDANRFYFGGLGRVPFLLNDSACLPLDFLQRAKDWQSENDRIRAEEQRTQALARIAKRERIVANGGESIDANEIIRQANDRLGADAFLQYLEYEKPQGDKYRVLPAFRVGSGSKSAFISPTAEGTWLYHDPSGGHDALDGFRFFCWLKRGQGYTARNSEFWELLREYCSGAGVEVPEFKRKAKGFAEPKAQQQWIDRVEHWQAWANRLDLTPTHTYSEPFTPLVLPDKPMAIIVQGDMGSRKTTQAVRGLIEDHRRKHPQSAQVNMSSRNLLQLQSVGIWGIPHHTQLESVYTRRGEAENAHYRVGDVALCPDSIMKIKPELIPPRSILCLDEFEQTAHHILSAETFGNHPRYSAGAILKRIKEVVEAVARTGWIIISEDGITNLGWEFIKGLTGLPDLPFEYHLCTWVNPLHKGRSVFLYDKESQYVKAFLAHAENGGKPWAPGDSKKFLDKLQRQAIDHLGWEPGEFPIVDSISAETSWAKALTANTDQELDRLHLKALGNTGSWQSGVSFGNTPEDNHFDSTWLYGSHIAPHVLKQYPERYRKPVPIHAHVKEFAVAMDDTGTAYLPETWMKNARGKKQALLWLQGFIDRSPDDVSLSEAILRMEDQADPEYGFWFRHLANFEARSCWGKSHLRQKMIEIWEAKGYNVQIISGQDRKVGAEFKLTGQKLDREAAEGMARIDVGSMTPSEALTILGSPASTHEDRQRAEKCLFIAEFCQALKENELTDPDFWLKTLVGDGKKLMAAVRMEWAAKSEKNLFHQTDQERNSFLRKLNRATKQGAIHWDPFVRSIALKAQMLIGSPIMDAIAKGLPFEEWDSNSEWVQEVHKWALENAQRIKRQMRLQVKPEHSPQSTVKKFLKALGYSTQLKKRRVNGNPTTYFISVDDVGEIRQKIQECLSCNASGVIQDLYKLPDIQKLDQLQNTIVFEKDRWFMRREKSNLWLCHHSLDPNDRGNWLFIQTTPQPIAA